MTRHRSRTGHPADSDTACPCGLPACYAACCGPLHRDRGAQAPTAERLMRSRFSAFAVRNRAYLLRTWHPGTRPEQLDLDPAVRWQRLEVLSCTGGSPFHSEGTVTFRASYSEEGHERVLSERSRFVRHGGAWVYLSAMAPH